MIKPRKLFVLQSFVSNALVIYPLYAIMFTERGGLSVGDVSILFAIWTAAALIFEVPTGLVADKYPRKVVLIRGELVKAGTFFILLFGMVQIDTNDMIANIKADNNFLV